MEKMFRFNFYKEWYYKELERRDQLANALNIPITLLTALFGLTAYLCINFNYKSKDDCIINLFILFISLSSIALVITMIMLLISYVHKYQFQSFPLYDFLKLESDEAKDAVKKFNNEIDIYNSNTDEDDLIPDSDKLTYDIEYEERLCILLIGIIEKNATNNDIKAIFILRAKIALSICFVLIFISLGIFTFNYFK